jgi:glycine cleavage system transcriptional repressor
VPLASFKKQFQSLQKRLGVSLVARELKEKPTIGPEIHQGQPHIISVLGKDRPGIVYHVSQLLAAHGVNITDVNTKVIGREGGRNLYAMVLEIEIPSPRAQSKVEAELKALGKRLKLDVNLRAIESLKL